MTIGKLLSLAASSAALVLSLITLAGTPVAVEAIECRQEGVTRGEDCLDSFPDGGFLCWQCVQNECHIMAQGDQECYDTCVEEGESICGGG